MMSTSLDFIPHRPSRGLSRGAPLSAALAEGDKRTTASTRVFHSRKEGSLVLARKRGFRICTFNVRTLNECGAAALLVKELNRLGISIAGLQEVPWPGSGDMLVDGSRILWSGRGDSQRTEGVGLVLIGAYTRSLLRWDPINERLLYARLRHMHGFCSGIVCYAPTEEASAETKDTFYQQLDDLLLGISSRDLLVCLGDFKAVSGTLRMPLDITLGPHGSGTSNDNTDRLLTFCRKHKLRVGGS